MSVPCQADQLIPSQTRQEIQGVVVVRDLAALSKRVSHVPSFDVLRDLFQLPIMWSFHGSCKLILKRQRFSKIH